MPRGDKSSYSSKQKRMARHIEESEKESGRSSKSAGRIAWATVNKRTGGAKGKGKAKGRSSRSTRTRSKQARSDRSRRSRSR